MVNRNPWGAKEDADGSQGVLQEANSGGKGPAGEPGKQSEGGFYEWLKSKSCPNMMYVCAI